MTTNFSAEEASMNNWPKSSTQLYSDTGGSGLPILILLHGLAGSASVWDGLTPILASEWPGRWIAPDLRGHGRSFHGGPYGYSAHASDVANLLEQDDEVIVLGHSMGGAVGMALAAGQFGIKINKVVAFGVKMEFSLDQVNKLKEIGHAPVRWFDSEDEAIDRYLKVSGMKGLINPQSKAAKLGVIACDGKFRMAMDPCANLVAGQPTGALIDAMSAPLHLAVGDNDVMVTLEETRRYDSSALCIPGLGHNMHIEAPERLWEQLKTLLMAP